MLGVDPVEARLPAAQGGVSQHALINQTDGNRLAVKVKCSDNNAYRVRPVYGMVEAGQALGLEVTRVAGQPPKEDKLVIQYLELPPDSAGQLDDAQAVFATVPAGTALPELRLPLFGE